MNVRVEPERAFREAVARLRAWVATVPLHHRGGEWECDYANWGEIYTTWKDLVAGNAIEQWCDSTIADALFAIARDNECQALAGELARAGSTAIVFVTEAALANGEADARWQLAHELGDRPVAQAEPQLLRLVADEDEYVRRRALRSLGRVGSDRVEEFASRQWADAADDMPWTRMNVLSVLHEIASPRLDERLREAAASSNAHLREYAEAMLQGDIPT